MTSEKPKIIYTMPSDEQIQKYVLDVCKTLKVKFNNKYFYQQEFIGGLTRFMKRAIKIQTDYLNQKQEQNNGTKKES